ncbi:hypothetical protein TorRG33x02_239450 [Trema orientale]|uniref:Uncharacterized protein n=1 Tax=Trema orientale TaxID=63057 RepID=A0A2P5DX26_TREOI|nr:hypothetical protein TorRG33x02_239450 [Trema orientale]
MKLNLPQMAGNNGGRERCGARQGHGREAHRRKMAACACRSPSYFLIKPNDVAFTATLFGYDVAFPATSYDRYPVAGKAT